MEKVFSHERTAEERVRDMRFENVMKQVDAGKLSREAAMIALREITLLANQQLSLEDVADE
jgi:hypothetical protein